MYWVDANSTKVGGPGKVVEIDEALFGKRKYNRGRLLQAKWVFGGYERESRKIFLMPVANRSKETLLEAITSWILPDTTIMSDMWRSYDCLNNEGFQHLSVNHKMNFVDPRTSKYNLS